MGLLLTFLQPNSVSFPRRREAVSVTHSRVDRPWRRNAAQYRDDHVLQPHSSSFHFFALGMCNFALTDYDRVIAAFLRDIEINPSFMPNH
jgi:hypothetical protein